MCRQGVRESHVLLRANPGDVCFKRLSTYGERSFYQTNQAGLSGLDCNSKKNDFLPSQMILGL